MVRTRSPRASAALATLRGRGQRVRVEQNFPALDDLRADDGLAKPAGAGGPPEKRSSEATFWPQARVAAHSRDPSGESAIAARSMTVAHTGSTLIGRYICSTSCTRRWASGLMVKSRSPFGE